MRKRLLDARSERRLSVKYETSEGLLWHRFRIFFISLKDAMRQYIVRGYLHAIGLCRIRPARICIEPNFLCRIRFKKHAAVLGNGILLIEENTLCDVFYFFLNIVEGKDFSSFHHHSMQADIVTILQGVNERERK